MTKIFSTYSEFLSREDKEINGISPSFAEAYPEYEKDNETNKGCWNCSDCSDCSRCSDCNRCSRCSGCSGCSRCSGCSGLEYKTDRTDEKSEAAPLYENVMGNYPVIENIHQKVFEAASQPKALDMTDWHTCDTTHCWAGWVVHLAGEAGAKLERQTSTLFASMKAMKRLWRI